MPLAGHGLRPTLLRRRASRPQLKRDPLGSTSLGAGIMLRLLQVVIALGGASYACRAYSAVYERHRATSESPDRVTEKWWRILSQAMAVLLLSFVFVVAAAAVRAPRWLALVLFGLLAASLLVAIAGLGALRWRAARGPS